MQFKIAMLLLIGVLFAPASRAFAKGPPAEALPIREAEQGPIDFETKGIGELSGIAYVGGDRFAVVSDKGGKLGFVTIDIDRETGAIASATLEQTALLEGGRDLEDLALHATGCLLHAVDESDQSLVAYRFPSLERVETLAVPDVFKQARPNLGFEALAATHDACIWIANEEPLKTDGPRATDTARGLVRLQHFGPDMRPGPQHAYPVDPHRGSDNLIERAQSGVVGLVALPNGKLVAMERELGGPVIPTFRIRLYLIDTAGATDTSEIDALDTDQIAPVRKQLLFETNAGAVNFEGIALGPKLDNGDFVLLLVSDNGGEKRMPQRLLALRLSGELAKPAPESAIDQGE
ncbi:MAG: esterase-like activity of phytase family protein [Phycisphaeraceae bacterium]